MKNIHKDPVVLSLSGSPEDSVELQDAGCIGPLQGTAQVTPTGPTILVRLKVQGRLGRDCGRCLEKLEAPFSIRADLLIEKGGPSSRVIWEETEQQGVEDYLAKVGDDVDEVPLDFLIAEQIHLNYHPNPLPELDSQGKCVACGKVPPQPMNPGAESKTDSRWDKLKSLKKDIEENSQE